MSFEPGDERSAPRRHLSRDSAAPPPVSVDQVVAALREAGAQEGRLLTPEQMRQIATAAAVERRFGPTGDREAIDPTADDVLVLDLEAEPADTRPFRRRWSIVAAAAAAIVVVAGIGVVARTPQAVVTQGDGPGGTGRPAPERSSATIAPEVLEAEVPAESVMAAGPPRIEAGDQADTAASETSMSDTTESEATTTTSSTVPTTAAPSTTRSPEVTEPTGGSTQAPTEGPQPTWFDDAVALDLGQAGTLILSIVDDEPLIREVRATPGWSVTTDESSERFAAQLSDGDDVAEVTVTQDDDGFSLRLEPTDPWWGSSTRRRTWSLDDDTTVTVTTGGWGLVGLDVEVDDDDGTVSVDTIGWNRLLVSLTSSSRVSERFEIWAGDHVVEVVINPG